MAFETDPQQYAELTKLVKESDDKLRADTIEKVNKILFENAENAITKIAFYTSKNCEITDPAAESVRLNASKHILKLLGMEVERQEHSGSVDFKPWVISRDE
jgi:hypothetical protein